MCVVTDDDWELDMDRLNFLRIFLWFEIFHALQIWTTSINLKVSIWGKFVRVEHPTLENFS